MQLLAALSPPPQELLAFLGVSHKGHRHGSSASRHGSGGLLRRAGGEGGSSGTGDESAARGAPSRQPGDAADAADAAALGGANASTAAAAAASSPPAAARSTAALVAGAGAGLTTFALRLWHGGQPLFDPTRLFSAGASRLSSSDGASGGWGSCVAVLAAWGLLYRALLRYG